jgi:hypothetical protein
MFLLYYEYLKKSRIIIKEYIIKSSQNIENYKYNVQISDLKRKMSKEYLLKMIMFNIFFTCHKD